MWDNRADNQKRLAEGLKARPDFTCKDKQNCGHIIWPEKKESGVKVKNYTQSTSQTQTREPIQSGSGQIDRSMEIARQAAGNALSRLYSGSQIDLTEFQGKIIPLAEFYKTGIIQTAPAKITSSTETALSDEETLADEELDNLPF